MRAARRMGLHEVHRMGTPATAMRRSMYTREMMRHSEGKRAHE
jgi:hypothetical protein